MIITLRRSMTSSIFSRIGGRRIAAVATSSSSLSRSLPLLPSRRRFLASTSSGAWDSEHHQQPARQYANRTEIKWFTPLWVSRPGGANLKLTASATPKETFSSGGLTLTFRPARRDSSYLNNGVATGEAVAHSEDIFIKLTPQEICEWIESRDLVTTRVSRQDGVLTEKVLRFYETEDDDADDMDDDQQDAAADHRILNDIARSRDPADAYVSPPRYSCCFTLSLYRTQEGGQRSAEPVQRVVFEMTKAELRLCHELCRSVLPEMTNSFLPYVPKHSTYSPR